MGKWWIPPSESLAVTVQIPDERETAQISSEDDLIDLLTLQVQRLIEEAYDPEETLGQMVRDLENASILGYGTTDLQRLMQPEMGYERGYCRPECVKCSEVCPTGAIRPITTADKSATQVGHAVWVAENCVVLTDGVKCGNCARHCPAGAIQMVKYKQGRQSGKLRIPAVNTERCIGCGACENLCPARPFSAIYVEGHSAHRTI